MIFTETKLKGAFIIDLERRTDERGFFARVFCQRDFRDFGLNPLVSQASIASNPIAGTLRGMHFQFPPAAETKLVRCTRGALLDIIVDLRPESPTYLHHLAVALDADNGRAIYVPARFAHGYQVLVDNTDVMYQMSACYDPGSEGGIPYNDELLRLPWPLPATQISTRDVNFRPLGEVEGELKRRMSLEEPAVG